MGATSVEAIKPDDGYIAFAGTSVSEMVTLTPNQLSATIVLKLGPKPGVVLPRVKDERTGKPVMSFMFHWAIVDGDRTNGHVSGGQGISQWDTRALVPPEKNLILTISVRGYKKWVYPDPEWPKNSN